MKIQFFDRGTPQGKKMFTDLDAVCQKLQIDYPPEYVHDMSRVYAMGVQCKSALVINNEVAFTDRYPSARELEVIIQDYL